MIQPAMPVTVDLPLVPPIATPQRLALNRAQQFRPAYARAAQFAGADHFGHGIFHGGGGNERLAGRNDAAAVLRVQNKAQAFQPGELFRRASLITAAV